MSDQPSLFLLMEAAERTGLSVDALRKRIRRGRLETVKGNDGLVRVRLTSADMEALRLADGQAGQARPSRRDENDRTIRALEDGAAILRERAEKAERRAERAEAEAGAERARASMAERGREEAQIRAAAADREVTVRREAEARERQGREAAEREIAEWTAGGPLARALRALAFRRGRVP
jgi:hypothetical protein